MAMHDIGALMLWWLTLVVAAPVLMLALECLAGAGRQRPWRYAGEPPSITVLMPAHDEARGIAPAIQAVLGQLRAHDELIVIADNCSDDTAEIARAMGARVVERHEPDLRGKGYALEAGRAAITKSPGRIVIIVDADCIAGPGALHRLASTSSRRDAVVQGAYLLVAPGDAPGIVRVSAFAFYIKNMVRQLGLRRLAGVTLLQGSGMAFPLTVFRQLDWDGGSLVEDLDMGLRLLAAGHVVTFDEGASFTSAAASIDATAGQRRRWEHGTMQAMVRNLPLLLRAACRRPRLLIVALDQMVPPTAILLAVATAMLIIVLGVGAWGPASLLLAALTLLAFGLSLAWLRFRRQLGGGMKLAEVGRYIWWKLPLAVQFLTHRERRWLRTERGQ